MRNGVNNKTDSGDYMEILGFIVVVGVVLLVVRVIVISYMHEPKTFVKRACTWLLCMLGSLLVPATWVGLAFLLGKLFDNNILGTILGLVITLIGVKIILHD